jgi:hypothetical protein
MSAATKIQIEYDGVLRRYRATCPVCGYVAVRSKREAAAHIIVQHVAYTHGVAVTA